MLIADPALRAELQTFNAELERRLAGLPPVHTLPVQVTRRARREGRGIWPPPVYLPQARELVAPSPAGGVTLRVLAPEGPSAGVYVHLHGGGHVLGSADGQDEHLWQLVQATGLCAVSVEYRLAPEHPHPAAADDCESAAAWLVAEGAAELGAPPVFAIGGESAGAHLAVLTLLRLRDRHRLAPFRAANLVYGVYDLSGTPSRRAWGDRNLVLSEPLMTWFADCLLPDGDPERRRDPAVSPLYADLRDLPPALFTVGMLDPLLDDSLFMAARWQAAGNRAELRVYSDAAHGFNLFPLEAARRANGDQHAFLKEAIA